MTSSLKAPDPRPLSDSDLPLVLALERSGQAHPWSDRSLKDELTHTHGFHFGIGFPEENPLAAFILCRTLFEELHIHHICTCPDFRRKGFARALLNHTLTAAGDRGVKTALLEVAAGNGAAIALYEQSGFSCVQRRKKYYAFGDDALVMIKTVQGSGFKVQG